LETNARGREDFRGHRTREVKASEHPRVDADVSVQIHHRYAELNAEVAAGGREEGGLCTHLEIPLHGLVGGPNGEVTEVSRGEVDGEADTDFQVIEHAKR